MVEEHGNMLLYGLVQFFFSCVYFYDLWRQQQQRRLMPMRVSAERESLGKKRTTVSGFFLYAFHLIQPQRAPPAQPFNQFCSVVVDFWESNLGRAPKFRYGNLNVIQKQNSINLRESRDFPQETFIHPEWKNPKRLPHFTPSRYVVSWIPFFPICTQCLFGADNLGRNIMSMG